MLMHNPYAKYQEQNTMTASPGELVLMLYDGCIKALRRAGLFADEKNFEETNGELIRAQSILAELQTTLDMRYEVSEGLFLLYDYMRSTAAEANVTKDTSALPEVIGLLMELREAWQQAVRENRRTTLMEPEAEAQ